MSRIEHEAETLSGKLLIQSDTPDWHHQALLAQLIHFLVLCIAGSCSMPLLSIACTNHCHIWLPMDHSWRLRQVSVLPVEEWLMVQA